MTKDAKRCLVEVSPFHTDSRYRLVRIDGRGWSPMNAQEFEPRVKEAFPHIDLHDAGQVDWRDRPWQWPR